jgi:hypothetical protein
MFVCLLVSLYLLRFYSKTGYDRGIRQFCRQNNITYQSFWTLTANPDAVNSRVVRQIAQKRGVTPEQVRRVSMLCCCSVCLQLVLAGM